MALSTAVVTLTGAWDMRAAVSSPQALKPPHSLLMLHWLLPCISYHILYTHRSCRFLYTLFSSMCWALSPRFCSWSSFIPLLLSLPNTLSPPLTKNKRQFVLSMFTQLNKWGIFNVPASLNCQLDTAWSSSVKDHLDWSTAGHLWRLSLLLIDLGAPAHSRGHTSLDR